MNKFKPAKGIRGYINKQKIIEIVRTLVMFGVSLGLYFYAYHLLGTNKSIWSIIAVLGILPASKSAVGMIMFLRFSSLSLEEYDGIVSCVGNVPTLYELIFTTKDKSFLVKACSCSMNTVILLADKSTKKYSSKELENHLSDCIEREGIKGITVKAYTDKENYCQRVSEMNSKLFSESDKSYDRIFKLFLSITL